MCAVWGACVPCKGRVSGQSIRVEVRWGEHRAARWKAGGGGAGAWVTDRGEGHQNQDATQQAPWSKVAAVSSRVDAVPTWGRVAPRTHDVNACGARQSLVCVVEGCIAQHRASHGGLLVERERKKACVATRALLFVAFAAGSSLPCLPRRNNPARRGSPFETRSTIRARPRSDNICDTPTPRIPCHTTPSCTSFRSTSRPSSYAVLVCARHETQRTRTVPRRDTKDAPKLPADAITRQRQVSGRGPSRGAHRPLPGHPRKYRRQARRSKSQAASRLRPSRKNPRPPSAACR